MNENYPVTRASNEAMIKLQEKRNQANKAMLIMVFGVFLLFIPPVGIIFLLFMCWRVNKLRTEMKGLYKDAFVREPLANNFQNVIYEPKEGFTLDNIKSFGICQTGNSYWSEDYIRATYAGIDFEVAEVHLIEVDKSSDSNHSETYFEGRMMVFNFPNKLVNTVSVFSKKFKHRILSRNDEKQYRVELEDIQFNNEFDVFSLVQLDAFYLITPHMMERLHVLAGKYESIAMNVIGNRVILAFNEPGKNVFDQNIDVGKLDIDQEMAKVQGEIDDIKLFISMILNLKA
ncbi:MAG: DUF3137 domain-containing protein [Lachnospiraceae bacterium]|nr:DUF3137 domain-containing protein [Lachnospiraceae bacterium]